MTHRGQVSKRISLIVANLKRWLQKYAVILVLIPLIASTQASSVLAASKTPTGPKSYNGPYNPTSAPASATDAVSPNYIMELVNGEYKIVNHSDKTISSGTLSDLVNTNGVFLSDQQVIWDPSTSRFYFSIFENRGTSSPNEGIAWGFSKTSTPRSAGDFCTYFNQFNYATTSFPDRQVLGDSSDFLLIGADRFATTGDESYEGSDLSWITKPATGSTCPSASSFQTGIQSLYNSDGSSPYSPVPARQVDNNSAGWVVATPHIGPANYVSMYSVTKDPHTGNAVISSPVSLSVAPFNLPPSAAQAGTTKSGGAAMPLETRVYFSEAYMAYDPRVGHSVIWTAHTTAGGAGSEVRWYEINPEADNLDQYGVISDPNLYVYNGSIAPDRVVNGSVSAFGSDAVINVNTSSPTAYTAVQTATVINNAPATALQMVKQSTGPDVDYTCYEPGATDCRWGDYSGASPDPGAALRGKVGRIWLINQWNMPDLNDTTPVWRTTLYQIKP